MAVKVTTKQDKSVSGSLFGQRVNDYKMLVKLRLSLTVVFSSVMAFLIAGSQPFRWEAIAILALGGFLVTGAANALNQVLEKDYDKLMKRTADRPLAAGRMSTSEAVLAAGLMSLVGIILLALFNPWTSFFGMLALVSYAFLYTPYKRVSPLAVVIGAVPGALPTLIGCVAAQGQLTYLALILFAIQFFWQFPHFWSIGWLGHEDYQRAGYRIMPEKDGKPDRRVGLQSFIYTIFLLAVSAMPFFLGVTGWISLAIVTLLGLCYAAMALQFYRKWNRKTALSLMFFSFAYIPFTLIVFYLDKI